MSQQAQPYDLSVGLGCFVLVSFFLGCVLMELFNPLNWMLTVESIGSNFMMTLLALLFAKLWWSSVKYSYKSWLLK